MAVAGIIIDSFGELRGLDAALHQEMANKCFVCGLERFDLETKGIHFSKHVEEDHVLWNYCNLIITLRTKNQNEYNVGAASIELAIPTLHVIHGSHVCAPPWTGGYEYHRRPAGSRGRAQRRQVVGWSG